MRWALLACLLLPMTPLVALFAFSQHPSPAPGEPGNSEQRRRDGPKQQAQPTKDATNKPATVVPVVKAGDAKQENGREATKKDNDAPIDWWVKVATVGNAIFSLALVLSTIGLWWVACKTANAARDTAEATRQAFIAAHRPRLIVRQVSMNADVINYFIYNVGDTPAKLVEVSERDWLPGPVENLSPLPPYAESVPVNVTLKSGEWMGRQFLPSDPEEFLTRYIAGRTRKHDQPAIFALGIITYEDMLGTRRNTAFLRQYDHATERFNPVNHPDYEYQD
jgi:hypothetical protein